MLGREIKTIPENSLPPCGGSGLKLKTEDVFDMPAQSPSMRREWIEMCSLRSECREERVSLHAEGVD